MKKLLPIFTLTFLIIFASICLTAESAGYHTDWVVVDSWYSPSKPKVGDTVSFCVKVGILTLIDPLPQTVDVACIVDEMLVKLASVTFTKPLDILTITAVWKATEGKHMVIWQIDPDFAYNDPNRENNISTMMFDVEPPKPTEATATTTVTEVLTTTTTVGEAVIRTETKTVTEPQILTLTSATTITEAKPGTEYPLELTSPTTYGGILGGIVALLLGFLFGRKTAPPKPPKTLLTGDSHEIPAPAEAIFSQTRLRPAKQLGPDEWEAKPGEYVPDAKGIVGVDQNGRATVVYDHSTLYDSEILGRPPSSEDFAKIDKEILEGLLEQLKYHDLELNDLQKKAIDELIQKMTEELHRRATRVH